MSALWPELQNRHMKINGGLSWVPYQKPNKICFALGTIFWVSVFFLYIDINKLFRKHLHNWSSIKIIIADDFISYF